MIRLPDLSKNICVGDILTYPNTGPRKDPARPHFHVVAITGAMDVILVPIGSAQSNADRTCLIEPQPDQLKDIIARQSVALFFNAKATTRASIASMLQYRKCELRPGDPASLALATKIAQGLFVSKRTPRPILKIAAEITRAAEPQSPSSPVHAQPAGACSEPYILREAKPKPQR